MEEILITRSEMFAQILFYSVCFLMSYWSLNIYGSKDSLVRESLPKLGYNILYILGLVNLVINTYIPIFLLIVGFPIIAANNYAILYSTNALVNLIVFIIPLVASVSMFLKFKGGLK